MKRDDEGNVCKPIYLQSRLHFDLSIPEEYDTTYQRLVKTLYGVEVYPKPKLGSKPEWVDKQIPVASKMIVTYDSIKRFHVIIVSKRRKGRLVSEATLKTPQAFISNH